MDNKNVGCNSKTCGLPFLFFPFFLFAAFFVFPFFFFHHFHLLVEG
jgi:hypothetical protein